jgi:hypothetical protein
VRGWEGGLLSEGHHNHSHCHHSHKSPELYNCLCNQNVRPVSIAERSKTCIVCDRSNIGIAGSNRASGMDVCPRVSVLCFPVSVEALRRPDPPSKESYEMSLYVDREAH